MIEKMRETVIKNTREEMVLKPKAKDGDREMRIKPNYEHLKGKWRTND